MAEGVLQYEPAARWGHVAAAVEAVVLHDHAIAHVKAADGAAPRHFVVRDAHACDRDRHIGQRDSFYSLAGGYADIYAGYDSRVNAQFGYSYRFVEAAEDKGPALTGEVGFDAAREEAVEAVDTIEMIYSARALVRFALDLEDGVALGQEVESLMNVESPEDTRLNSETSLTAKLSESLALKFSYKLNYDSQPVEGYSKADQTGLVTVVTSLY